MTSVDFDKGPGFTVRGYDDDCDDLPAASVYGDDISNAEELAAALRHAADVVDQLAALNVPLIIVCGE